MLKISPVCWGRGCLELGSPRHNAEAGMFQLFSTSTAKPCSVLGTELPVCVWDTVPALESLTVSSGRCTECSRDKYSDDNIRCHPLMKEAGRGGWGSGVRRGFPQNQIPYPSVKGQIGIITMTRRAGKGLWRQLDYQAGWCGGQRELGHSLEKCQQLCKAALWGAPGDTAKVRPLGPDTARLCWVVWVIFWKMIGSHWEALSRMLWSDSHFWKIAQTALWGMRRGETWGRWEHLHNDSHHLGQGTAALRRTQKRTWIWDTWGMESMDLVSHGLSVACQKSQVWARTTQQQQKAQSNNGQKT